MEVDMGSSHGQPAQDASLSTEQITINARHTTRILTGVAVGQWLGSAAIFSMTNSSRWLMASIAAATVVSVAAIASMCVDAVRAMTEAHARRMEELTRAHAKELKDQVLAINWLTTSKFRGKALAELDAALAAESDDQSDTGPMRIVNGTR